MIRLTQKFEKKKAAKRAINANKKEIKVEIEDGIITASLIDEGNKKLWK